MEDASIDTNVCRSYYSHSPQQSAAHCTTPRTIVHQICSVYMLLLCLENRTANGSYCLRLGIHACPIPVRSVCGNGAVRVQELGPVLAGNGHVDRNLPMHLTCVVTAYTHGTATARSTTAVNIHQPLRVRSTGPTGMREKSPAESGATSFSSAKAFAAFLSPLKRPRGQTVLN